MLSSTFGVREREHYNRLGPVEDSYERLQERHEFVEFLAQFAELAHDNGLQGEAGAFLLHRHFTAGEGQVLLEEPATLADGQPALITRATPSRGADMQAVRWRLGADGVFHALEFSGDVGAADAAKRLGEQGAFIDGYATLVRQFELQDLIGLSVADRHYLVPSDQEWLIEKTDDETSVVTLEPATQDDQGFIPTCWVPTIEMYCSPMNRCDPIVSCQRRCSYQGDAGHQYGGHNQVNVSHNRIMIGHDDR